MKIKQVIKWLFAMAALAFCPIWADSVYAVGDDVPDYRIGIAPTQQSFERMEPGSSYNGVFKVRNSGKEPIAFSIGFAPYSVASETYEPDYVKETKYTTISKWIEVDKDAGDLDVGEETEIRYTINVPISAAGGAQAATILVTMINDDASSEENAIETVQQVGYLVFGNVDGDIVQTGKVLENKVPSFLFNPPIYATSIVENTGNVYTAAKYSLQVFPLFSDEEVYTNEEKPEDSIIFPETKRMNQIQWEGAPQLGIFRVRSTVKIFDEESVTEKLVFLCPIWFLFIILLLIFCIIFWLVSRIFRRKREA